VNYCEFDSKLRKQVYEGIMYQELPTETTPDTAASGGRPTVIL